MNDDIVCKALCDNLLGGIDIHRCQAAQALGHLGGDAAVDALIKALLDEDEDVRSDAATALARIGDSRANTQLLENLIGDPCSDVKLAAMTALAASGNEDVKPWLLRILAGRDEEINWDEEEYYVNGWDDWLDMQIAAIEALAQLKVVEAVPHIVAALSDDDALDICETGMRALTQIGPSGVTALAGFMDHKDKRHRRRAAFAISSCDGPDARKAVLQAIEDPAMDVRLAVLRGLAGVNPGDERLAALLLDKEPEVRAQAVRLCGAEHGKRLELLFDDKSQMVQAAVLELLTKSPNAADFALLDQRISDILHSENGTLAALAAPALAAVAPERALAELVELMASADASVELKRGVIRGLKIVGGDEAVQALAGILDNDDRQVRLDAMAAISVLAGKGQWPNEAATTLISALAGELVAEPETPEPVEEDEQAAEDEVEDAGEENVAEGIEAIGEDEEADKTESFPSSTLAAIISDASPQEVQGPVEGVELLPEDIEFLKLAKAKKMGKKMMPLVPDVATHEDVRNFAARVLGDFPQQNVALALLETISDSEGELKQIAIESLAQVSAGLGEWPEGLLEMWRNEVKSSDRDVRLQAVRALGFIDDISATSILINGLKDEDSFVRVSAIRSLARLGETGSGVARMLNDEDSSVRLAAAEVMAQTGIEAVKPLVDFAYSFEGYHGREAARMMTSVHKEAANALFIETLNDESRKRYWIVAILALEELNRSDNAA